eukprot:TRINITY_DN2844_c0_g1_i1.p1 TRINITY_DN2844_c0_g1~~TRINITY_DN2844_c0_g1_i1.p1  ORF type:complete len:344 (+),score=136.02 TRINITY_DN2844_c0_g1_i1:135-1166(+)
MGSSGIETAFLKDQVGAILAQGIAETVAVRPADPVEFLAKWLLHQLEQDEVQQRRREEGDAAEREKEEWGKAVAFKQARAAQVIQREWKHHTKLEEDHKHRERALLLLIQDVEHEVEEADEYREDTLQVEEFEGQTDLEKEKEMDLLKAQLQYRKALAVLHRLDKSTIADIKRLKNPDANVVLTVKCCFYVMNRTPKQVRTWMLVRMLIKPSPFLEAVLAYDPLRQGEKRRKFLRIKRLLRRVNEEELKKASVAVFLLHQWLVQCLECRERHHENVALKKELGRDAEEEEEDEEDDPHDKDEDEEQELLLEQQELERRRLSEEARMREEGEEGEGEQGTVEED